nr:hypothetical protein [Haloterrigena gelatinilytica]
MEADAKRFAQRGFRQCQRLGNGMDEFGGPREILPQSTIRSGCGHELDVLTEVVIALPTVLTLTARNSGFDRNAITGRKLRDVLSDGDDFSRAFVAEYQRFVYRSAPHLSVFIPV